LIFATDEGSDDPTYSSHHYMAEPLAEYIRDKAQFQTTTIMGDTATKTELTAALMNNKPAIVYTAGHGLAAPNQPLDVQMKVNGAICCQSENESIEKWCFTGDDVPLDRPFLEGSAFFQFACFGYGTPAESDFSPWVDKTLKFEKDFVAALPKKLLSHPNGPIAFVGHLDTAFLCGFDNDPTIPIGSFGTRMEPFLSAVQKLLKSVPVGLAMLHMNRRYSELSIELSNFYNEVQANKKSIDSSQDWLANTFMYREDAQNYLVLGDPAARICIPSES